MQDFSGGWFYPETSSVVSRTSRARVSEILSQKQAEYGGSQL
jgi:hypothetical protein